MRPSQRFSPFFIFAISATFACSQSSLDPHEGTYQNLNVKNLLTAQEFRLSGVFTLNNAFHPTSRVNQNYTSAPATPLIFTSPVFNQSISRYRHARPDLDGARRSLRHTRYAHRVFRLWSQRHSAALHLPQLQLHRSELRSPLRRRIHDFAEQSRRPAQRRVGHQSHRHPAPRQRKLPHLRSRGQHLQRNRISIPARPPHRPAP